MSISVRLSQPAVGFGRQGGASEFHNSLAHRNSLSLGSGLDDSLNDRPTIPSAAIIWCTAFAHDVDSRIEIP